MLQIVLLSKSTISPDKNLQYVVKIAQSMSKVTIMSQTINETVYGINMYTYCTPYKYLTIVNHSKMENTVLFSL